MIVKLNGQTSMNKLNKVVREVVGDIQERAGLQGASFRVKDVQMGIVFNIDGEEQFLNITHDGVEEVFQVYVALDDKGNIKKQSDNEKESFMDKYSRAVASGKDTEYEPITSVFDPTDLHLLATEEAYDMTTQHLIHEEKRLYVTQYYKRGVLVGELAFTSDGQAVDLMEEQYKDYYSN